jgi:hypothetical protein
MRCDLLSDITVNVYLIQMALTAPIIDIEMKY